MKLVEFLKLHGMSATKLSAMAGVPASSITRYLLKKRGLSAGTAAKISSATGGEVTIAELLYEDGIPEKARIAL